MVVCSSNVRELASRDERGVDVGTARLALELEEAVARPRRKEPSGPEPKGGRKADSLWALDAEV